MNMEVKKIIKVNSTNINAIVYNSKTRILTIEFNNGGLYNYYDVPQYIYYEIMSAPSKGKYFHRFIKNEYRTKDL